MFYQQFIEIQPVLNIILSGAGKSAGHPLGEEGEHEWGRNLSWPSKLHGIDPRILFLYTVLLNVLMDQGARDVVFITA